jgi:hypothetical protein
MQQPRVAAATEARDEPRIVLRTGAERSAGSAVRAASSRQPMLRIPQDEGPVIIPEDRPYVASVIVTSRLRRDENGRLVYFPCTTNCGEEPSAEELNTPPIYPPEAVESVAHS